MIQKITEKGYFSYLLYTLVVLIIIFFIIRNSIVKFIFENKCTSLKNRYGLIINAEKVGISGIRTLYLHNFSIVPTNYDTLLTLRRGEVRLGFLDLLRFKINPLEVRLVNPKLNFVGHRSNSNYHFLFGNRKDTNTLASNNVSENNQFSRQNTIYRALKALFGLTTASYEIDNFVLSYSDSAYNAKIIVPRFVSNSSGFNTRVEMHEGARTQFINLKGLASKRKSSITLNASMSGDRLPLPLLNHKLGINLSFDSLELKFISKQLISKSIELQLKSSVVNLNVHTKRLSDQPVIIRKGEVDLDITVTPEFYQIDSTSRVDLNGLKSNLFIKYQPKNDKLLSLKINAELFPTQQLFDALPDGLFTNLKGIKTNGTIDFGLDFRVKISKPDSIYLVSKFLTDAFSIAQYGLRNFSAINDTFSHDVYDDGYYVRTIHLGATNKEYKTLNQISPLIINAIVTSEDGGFFNNSGFDIDAFKYAIKENLKQKRFVRGGSTITMQLIKNLYLNKNKNLFRKAEEYLIVWLLGSQGIVSKERMMEIYLNIIEWGPNVYGINEASRYYFGKDPNNVTLDEAIFLASVIPRPKKFKYLFEKDGNLKSFMESDFNFIADKMLQRGMISEEQFNTLLYNVHITGSAKELLIDTTSYPMDSVVIDEIRIHKDSTLLLP